MKKTIFISSTYKDLVKERKAVWELLKRYDVNIVGMEEFGARKDSPLTTCLKEVEQSEYIHWYYCQSLGKYRGRKRKILHSIRV